MASHSYPTTSPATDRRFPDEGNLQCVSTPRNPPDDSPNDTANVAPGDTRTDLNDAPNDVANDAVAPATRVGARDLPAVRTTSRAKACGARNTLPRVRPRARRQQRSDHHVSPAGVAICTPGDAGGGATVVFLNNRYHDPTLGNFISVDPIVSVTRQPYAYGANNPITFMDPTGLKACLGQGDCRAGHAEAAADVSPMNAIQPGVNDRNELQNVWANHIAMFGQQPIDPYLRANGSLVCVGLDGCKAALGYLNGSEGTDADIWIAKWLALNAGVASGGLGSSSNLTIGEKYINNGLMLFGGILSHARAAARAAAGGSTPGSLNITGSGFSASERAVAMELAERGNAVVLRQANGPGRMSDLLINGLAYDVYSPTTGNVSRIVSAVASKGSQVRGGGVVIDLSGSSLTAADLGNILARVQNVTTQISDIIVIG
jgi:Contact-dependent growth inhibition CdiA C-terminal domain